jgi:hypothetical protein
MAPRKRATAREIHTTLPCSGCAGAREFAPDPALHAIASSAKTSSVATTLVWEQTTVFLSIVAAFTVFLRAISGWGTGHEFLS